MKVLWPHPFLGVPKWMFENAWRTFSRIPSMSFCCRRATSRIGSWLDGRIRHFVGCAEYHAPLKTPPKRGVGIRTRHRSKAGLASWPLSCSTCASATMGCTSPRDPFTTMAMRMPPRLESQIESGPRICTSTVWGDLGLQATRKVTQLLKL